jgi:predicted transcriptional regulator
MKQTYLYLHGVLYLKLNGIFAINEIMVLLAIVLFVLLQFTVSAYPFS